MVEYKLLSQAQRELKGNIIIKVKSLGDLTAGSGSKGDWTKKDAIIEDNSGEQKLTLWNDDIKKIEEGKYYKLENPFWKDYEGKPNLSLGQYCKIHEATEADLLPADGSATQRDQTSAQTSSPASTPVSDEDLRKFAEECVKSFIQTCKSEGIDIQNLAQGASAVYNTAIMHRAKAR